MELEKSTMFFNLSSELEYAAAGDHVTTATLEMRPPGMDEFEEASNLSQLVMGAMLDTSRLSGQTKEAEESPKDVKIDANTIKLVLFSSQSIKFISVAKSFDRLAVKVCTADGKVRLTETLIKKISLEDYTRLICEYIANFILPSLGLDEGGA